SPNASTMIDKVNSRLDNGSTTLVWLSTGSGGGLSSISFTESCALSRQGTRSKTISPMNPDKVCFLHIAYQYKVSATWRAWLLLMISYFVYLNTGASSASSSRLTPLGNPFRV